MGTRCQEPGVPPPVAGSPFGGILLTFIRARASVVESVRHPRCAAQLEEHHPAAQRSLIDTPLRFFRSPPLSPPPRCHSFLSSPPPAPCLLPLMPHLITTHASPRHHLHLASLSFLSSGLSYPLPPLTQPLSFNLYQPHSLLSSHIPCS